MTTFDIIFVCVMPLIGAIIGYVTNVLAVKMLFHPRKPRRIIFWKFQGLVPSRQKEIAKRFADVVSNEFVTAEEISAGFDEEKLIERLLIAIDDEISNFISEKMGMLSPLLTALISPDLITNVRAGLLNEIRNKLPVLFANLKSEITETYDIKTIVEEKIAKFSLEKLEDIILAVSKQELKQIERLGGFLGFFIGLLQSLIYFISIVLSR